MLDGIQDVRNLGAILRSAYCTGVDGVILMKKHGAPLNAGGNTYYTGLPSVPPGQNVSNTGYQEAQELTATVQYALWANVLTRVEVRWDHVNHGDGYTTPAGSNQQNAFMLAAQAIYTF